MIQIAADERRQKYKKIGVISARQRFQRSVWVWEWECDVRSGAFEFEAEEVFGPG